jgi:hypothetical protein
MKPTDFELMRSLQDTLRDEANALFREYQALHKQIIGYSKLEEHYRQNTLDEDYFFVPTNFMDDLPPLPFRDPWDETPVPTLLEQMMKECELHFRHDLGYEGQYNSFKLPLRWLFDPNWKTEATAMLQQELEQKRLQATKDREQWERQERETLARLAAKYGEKK